MPWKTSSLLQARQRFVRAALAARCSVAQLCRDAGISRKTGFKWMRRYRDSGSPGLRDRSRRPGHSPHRTAARWLQAIRQLRRVHPHWGAKKIYATLRRRHARSRLPKVRTITDWLTRWGLGRRRRRRWARPGPLVPHPAGRVPHAPNEVWTADFKGWFCTRDGQRVDPLSVRDLFSRFVLDIRLLPQRHAPVQSCFRSLFRRYGLPKVIRTDHGTPFAGDGALELSRLSAWWLRLGIQVEFTRRAHPQDNAAHEQMHRVYQREVAARPAATPRAQQWCTTRWVRYYNHHRPHEALEQRVPAALYRPSPRRYRPGRPVLRYRRDWRTRLVTASGYVRWGRRLRVIGRAFGGQRVGFKPLVAGMYEVYFGRQLIGVLVDTDQGGLRPARLEHTPINPDKA